MTLLDVTFFACFFLLALGSFMLGRKTGYRSGFDLGYRLGGINGMQTAAERVLRAYEAHSEPEKQVEAMDKAAWHAFSAHIEPHRP